MTDADSPPNAPDAEPRPTETRTDGGVPTAPTPTERDPTGTRADVGRLRGRLFAWACLGATLVALGAMAVFLLYVGNDALAPLTADPGWLATYAVTVIVPAGALAAYYVRTDPAAGRVAYTALGVPVVAGLLASGVWILVEHLLVPIVPLALAGSLVAAVAVGRYVDRVRESRRDGVRAGAGLFAVAAAGLGLAPLVGVTPTTWVVVTTVVVGATGLYVEHVLRRGEGTTGLAFPLVVAGGVALGWLVTGAFGFVGPDAWLDVSFLTSAHDTSAAEAGIYPALVGSVFMLLVLVVATFPVGVGAAIYLEEYASKSGWAGKAVELVEVNVANLAGVPSVVYGVLGLTVFVRTLHMEGGTALVGGLTVGLLILPIVIVSTQEAIRSVPDSRRNAAYGMGATRWQTIRTVVLPEALPGIFTGTILALGRAIGETAPLLMIGLAASVRVPPSSLVSRTGVMPRQIYTWSTLIETEFRYGVLAAGVFVLLTVLLTMNAAAIVLRNRSQRA